MDTDPLHLQFTDIHYSSSFSRIAQITRQKDKTHPADSTCPRVGGTGACSDCSHIYHWASTARRALGRVLWYSARSNRPADGRSTCRVHPRESTSTGLGPLWDPRPGARPWSRGLGSSARSTWNLEARTACRYPHTGQGHGTRPSACSSS